MSVINFELFSGDTFRKKITIQAKDAEGTITPVPLNDFTCFFTAKRSLSDTNERAVIEKRWTDHEDPINGVTQIVLEADETVPVGSFYYVFGYFTPDDQKRTLWEGKIVFKKSADLSTEP